MSLPGATVGPMIIAALVISIVAALAAVATAEYARRANRSAADSARAAAETARLDADRRHDELTPQFHLTFTERGDGAADQGELRVELTGPPGLDHLDEVTASILDDGQANHWADGRPAGITAEQARRFVWGPWEFNTGASAQVADNRTSRPRPYSRAAGANWDRLSLRRTRPGHWMETDAERWRKQQPGPIRLQITSRRGDDQWTDLYQVPVPE
jgi:hypothetical protein